MKTKFHEIFQFKIVLEPESNNPPIWRRIQVPSVYTFYDLHVAIQNAMGWNDEHLHYFEIKNPSSSFKAEIHYWFKDVLNQEGYDKLMTEFLLNPEKCKEEYNKLKKMKNSGELKKKWEEILEEFLGFDVDIKFIFSSDYEWLKDEIKNKIPQSKYYEFKKVFLMKTDSLTEYYFDNKAKISDFFAKVNRTGYYIYDLGDEWRHSLILEEVLPRGKWIVYPNCLEGEGSCPFENSGGYHAYLNYVEILKDHHHPEYNEVKDWIEMLDLPLWRGKIDNFDSEYFNPNEIEFEDPVKHRRAVESRE